MSKSSFQSHMDPVPSYEESIGAGSTRSTWTPATLHQQLDDARLSRVRDVLSTYVDPLLAVQGASGIYKTVFLLVPSNVDALQHQAGDTEYSSAYSTPKEPEVVGFAATDVVKLIRLKGEEHTVEFWRQPAVMEELATNLRMRLKMSGHRVEEPAPLQDSPEEPAPSVQNGKKASSWFRSKDSSKSKKPKTQPTSLWTTTAPSEATITDHKLGWRAAHEDANFTKSPGRGEVRVDVQWKELCLRAENAVGLYDTRKGPGICLSVEVGV